jgi:hypothetical protein
MAQFRIVPILNCRLMRWAELSLRQQLVSKFTMVKLLGYSWLNGVAPATMFPSLYQHSKRKGRTVAEAMANRNWIGDLMHNLMAALLIKYTLLWELVDASHYDQHDQEEDFIIWSLTGDAEYSAKSAYSVQFEGSVKSTFPSKLWKVWAPSQCKSFFGYCFRIEYGRQTGRS